MNQKNPNARLQDVAFANRVVEILRASGHKAEVVWAGPKGRGAHLGEGPWQIRTPATEHAVIDAVALANKMSARGVASGQRANSHVFSPPFGPGETRIYLGLAERIARGDKRAAVACQRVGLLRAYELRTFGPRELAARVVERLDVRPNPLLALVGNKPPRNWRPKRRPNDTAPSLLTLKIPRNIYRGKISLEELRRLAPQAARKGVARFKDFWHGAEPGDDVILLDDGRPDLRVKWFAGRSPEIVYGGKGGYPPGTPKAFDDNAGIYVHKSPHTYLLGDALTDEFTLIGSMKARKGWLRS